MLGSRRHSSRVVKAAAAQGWAKGKGCPGTDDPRQGGWADVRFDALPADQRNVLWLCMLHPRVGPLTVNFEVLTPLQNPDQRLVIYRAADTASQAALDTIIRDIADRVPTLRAM